MLGMISDIIKFFTNVDLDKVLLIIAEVKALIKMLQEFFESPDTPNVNGKV